MKRLIVKEILKMGAKSILLATVIGAAIGIMGYINTWDTSIEYSNAFFIAGCLMIIAGTASRFTASQERNNFQQFHAESFRGMSSSEQANFIINTSSSVSAVILGVLSGLLLIMLSAIAVYIF